jgi:hypothetical protein
MGVGSNPFITYVIPVAAGDDLLMNVLLSLSASEHGVDTVVRHDGWKHYALAIRQLRQQNFQDVKSWETSKCARILLILVMIAHVEVKSTLLEYARTERQPCILIANDRLSEETSQAVSFLI